jgi:hypothetical protein
MHPLPHMSSWRSAYLVKHRDNFTLLYLSQEPVFLDEVSLFLTPSKQMLGYQFQIRYNYFQHPLILLYNLPS